MKRVYPLVLSIVGVSVMAAILAGCAPAVGPKEMQGDPQAAQIAARKTLYAAAISKQGEVRARAMESLAHTERAAAGETLLRGLSDQAAGVQFVAAMGVGDIRYAPAILKLRQMAADARLDGSVRCGVIFAMHRLGDDSLMSSLGKLLYAREPEVRANAALVLGRMGLPSAIRPLRSRADVEMNHGVRMQLAESLALLGDVKNIGMLKAYARVGQPHERMAAIEALGWTGQLSAKGTLLWAVGGDQPPPLRLTAARALARLDDDRGYLLALDAVVDPTRFTQRSYKEPVVVSDAQKHQMQGLGSLALGEMGREAAVDALLPLLESPNPTVAVSAARSILYLLRGQSPPKPPTVPAADPSTGPTPRSTDVQGPGILRTAPMKE